LPGAQRSLQDDTVKVEICLQPWAVVLINQTKQIIGILFNHIKFSALKLNKELIMKIKLKIKIKSKYFSKPEQQPVHESYPLRLAS